MERSLKWRVGLIGFFVVLAVVYLLPNVVPRHALPRWMPDKKLTLGLDLQGGLHLQYSVEVDKAVADKLNRVGSDMADRLRAKKADAKFTIKPDGASSLRIDFETAEDRELLDERFLSDFISLEKTDAGPRSALLTIPSEIIDRLKEGAVEKSIETIRSRVNEFGVSEPDIRKGKEGTDIVVQLPGLSKDNFDRAKRLIGQTAQLEFKLLDDDNADKWTSGVAKDLPKDDQGVALVTVERDSTASYLKSTRKDVLAGFLAAEGRVDAEHEIGYSQEGVKKGGVQTTETFWRTYYLKRSSGGLTGEFISDARVAVDQRDRRPFVSLNFDGTGATIFCDLTKANVKKRMAIMLDDVVNSAPVINEPICGGRAQITMGGLFRTSQELFDEARDLVTVLEHGALPAPIHKQFDTEVGPSLGRDSVEAGKRSMMVGGLAVVLFMILYYQLAGVFATAALALNVLFIMAVLTGFEATLTLPGIAGIILTIGMAVDANVIIFERVREELRSGKTPRSAVDTGYSKAWRAIFDANVTTFIAGVVLYNYGSGPIKGFAVTLMIGIITSVFTAIVVTRVLFDYITTRRKAERLSI